MFDSNVFDYINVLDKAADASWIRNQALNNNIANIDTPGYKRQDVSFESLLSQELESAKNKSLDKQVADLDLNKITGTVYTDNANLSYRLDENNVDVDTENVELASNQIKYEGLMNSMTAEFSRLQSVMK